VTVLESQGDTAVKTKGHVVSHLHLPLRALSRRLPVALGLVLIAAVNVVRAADYQTYEQCRIERERVYRDLERERNEHDTLYDQCNRVKGAREELNCMKSNNLDARTRRVSELSAQYSKIDKDCNALYELSLRRNSGPVTSSRPQPARSYPSTTVGNGPTRNVAPSTPSYQADVPSTQEPSRGNVDSVPSQSASPLTEISPRGNAQSSSPDFLGLVNGRWCDWMSSATWSVSGDELRVNDRWSYKMRVTGEREFSITFNDGSIHTYRFTDDDHLAASGLFASDLKRCGQ
jgi:hypothetical protein